MRLRRSALLACFLYLMVQGVQAMPAVWRMHCLLSGRSVLQWGQAKGCMPDREHPDHDIVDVHCCAFSNAMHGVLEQDLSTDAARSPASVGPVGMPCFSPAVPEALSHGPAALHAAHGPPPEPRALHVVRLRSLLI